MSKIRMKNRRELKEIPRRIQGGTRTSKKIHGVPERVPAEGGAEGGGTWLRRGVERERAVGVSRAYVLKLVRAWRPPFERGRKIAMVVSSI